VKVHILKFTVASKSCLEISFSDLANKCLYDVRALKQTDTFYISDDVSHPDRLVSMAMASTSMNLL